MPNTNRAIFLDRDGVVNEEVGYVWEPEKFVLQAAIFELAAAASAAGYSLIIITNQGGIGKGLYTLEQMTALHQILFAAFEACSLPKPDIYYCPHHPDSYKCFCRKPEGLFFERALAKYKLVASQCWMLGDRERDLIPARKLGIQTIYLGLDVVDSADYQFESLPEANAFLLPRLVTIPVTIH